MPIHKKSKINRAIVWLHLWLGLLSGIIVVIVSITGCLYVFQKEISDRIYKNVFFVTPPEKDAVALPLSQLQKTAQETLGTDSKINYITTYSQPNHAWEFMAYKPGNPDALTFFGSVKYYQSAFVNPYTGKVTGTINYMHNFFVIVKYIHWSLYLSTKYGQPIVGWATLIFVISLITGFIMWIPRRWNKMEKNKAFTISWKARFKRLNYDLHNVLGFYTIVIALILGLTGMMYSFRWFNAAVYSAGALSTKAPTATAFLSKPVTGNSTVSPIDQALLSTHKKFPDAARYALTIPAGKQAPLSVTAYHKKEVYYDFDVAYYDQYSGKSLGQQLYKNKNNGEKIVAMKYDLHVGSIGGLFGKIIAFIVSLVCASLPITGFMIWWGKKKKKRKQKDKPRFRKVTSKQPVGA